MSWRVNCTFCSKIAPHDNSNLIWWLIFYKLTMKWMLHQRYVHTLYNAILRIARKFLETRENIKISTHPFYHINLGWFSWEWSKKFFYFEKKNSKWPTQKKLVFQNRQFSKSAILNFFLEKKNIFLLHSHENQPKW